MESVCRGNSTEGSNPSLSATFLAFGSSLSARVGFQGHRARRRRASRLGSNPSLSVTLAYFFAGAFAASTGLRSNGPSLSTKNTHSEAGSHEVVCR